MKYIYYIIIIILCSSVIVAYSFFSRQTSTSETAIIINDMSVSRDEYDRQFRLRPPYLLDENDFIDALVTKKLLIQEAIRLGIDQDESFRWSIQNFYEQSLIKLLTDHAIADIAVEVTDQEIDRYIFLSGKKLHLTSFSFASLDDLRADRQEASEQLALFFRELSVELKNTLLALEEGGRTGPVRTDGGYRIYQLDRIESMEEASPAPLTREDIEKTLQHFRKEKQLRDWITKLKDDAQIKILIK